MPFAGGAISALMSGLFEHKPDVPSFQWVDLVQQQLDTTAGNLGVLTDAEKLGSGVNEFMRGERAKTLSGIPGLGDIEQETAANLKSWLKGELPSDVTSAVERGANARAYAGGYGGAGMGRNLTSRDLGLTSLDLMTRAVPMGEQFAQSEYNLRKIPEFNPSSMFIDPMSAAQFNRNQYNQQWNRDWLNARIDAQPEPWQQSLMNSWNAGMSMADAFGASYLGAMAGTPMAGQAAASAGSNAGMGGTMQNYNQMLESGQVPGTPAYTALQDYSNYAPYGPAGFGM